MDPHNDFDKHDRPPVLCRCGHERDDHDSRTEMRRGQKAYVQKCAQCACEVFVDADGPLSRMMDSIPVYPTAIHYEETNGNAEHGATRIASCRESPTPSTTSSAIHPRRRVITTTERVLVNRHHDFVRDLARWLEDLNLHCTDHAPDPDCDGCRTQLAGFKFDLDGPAGGARGCNQEEQRTPQSTGTLLSCPDEIAIRVAQRVAELPDRTSPDGWPEAMLVTSSELQFIVTDEINAAVGGEETLDSILLAVKADRAAISDFLLSCREGGNMTNAVQVFDVLASKIRNGEHLTIPSGS